MNDNIQVVCPNPFCRAILGIRIVPGLESAAIRCPRCGQTRPYTDYCAYRQPAPQSSLVSKTRGEETIYMIPPSTKKQLPIGGLLLPGEAEPLQLHLGHNLVGRDAPSSSADIRVPDPKDKRQMSRTHMVVEVTETDESFRHLLSLCPGSKNPTFINDKELLPGDAVFLHHGNHITVGYQTLRFVQWKEEGTIYDKTKLTN